MPQTNVKYYDPKQSTIKSLFTWKATIFELVLQRPEFYIYIAWNLILTTVCIFGLEEGTIDDFEWDAATVMQYVMTFFVTFYNDRCFERYQELYPACMDFMDNVILLVQEMNISLHFTDLYYHRMAVTKYLLAVVHEYFMIVCGGKLTRKSWDQLIKKGLLTEEEAKILEEYPGGETTFVLTSWCMFIIKDALVQNCMWRADERSQQTVHIYNRHIRHIINIQKACRKIGYTMANPIPFAYYHLMNVILVLNVLLLATFSALFRSYMTVLPFGIALLIYMGMREVSTALADPFGRDSVDFPIPHFIRSCFDRAACLLIAFTREDVRGRVRKQIEQVEEFTEDQLRRFHKPSQFGDSDLPSKGSAVQFQWSTESYTEDAEEDIKKRLKWSLSLEAMPNDELVVAAAEQDVLDELARSAELKSLIEEETEKRSGLTLELQDLKFEHSRIVECVRELMDRFPQLLDGQPAFRPQAEMMALEDPKFS